MGQVLQNNLQSNQRRLWSRAKESKTGKEVISDWCWRGGLERWKEWFLQPRRRLVRQGLRACMGKGGSGLKLEEGSQL